MKAESMSLMEIRIAGMEALLRELGPVGMIRFLQQYETGEGDYTQERHTWLDSLDLQTIAEKIYNQRKKD